jgi:hypothetical protein
MAYERNTTEGIRSWLQAELSTPGWNSSTIAKGLTEDVMNIIIENYKEFDTKIRQAIILTTVYMRKGDLLSLGDGLNKVNFIIFFFSLFCNVILLCVCVLC